MFFKICRYQLYSGRKEIAEVTNLFFQFTFLENRSRGEIKIKTIKIFTFMKNRSKGEVKITNMPDIGQMLMIIFFTTVADNYHIVIFFAMRW